MTVLLGAFFACGERVVIRSRAWCPLFIFYFYLMKTKTSHFFTIPVVLPLIILKFGQILDAIPSNPAWNSFRNSSARFLSGLRYLSSSLKQHHSKTTIKVPPSRVDPPFFTVIRRGKLVAARCIIMRLCLQTQALLFLIRCFRWQAVQQGNKYSAKSCLKNDALSKVSRSFSNN